MDLGEYQRELEGLERLRELDAQWEQQGDRRTPVLGAGVGPLPSERKKAVEAYLEVTSSSAGVVGGLAANLVSGVLAGARLLRRHPPTKAEIRSYRFHEKKSSSTPGVELLRRVSPSAADSLDLLVDSERRVLKEGAAKPHLYSRIIASQCIEIESVLQRLFAQLPDAVHEQISGQLTRKQVAILERATEREEHTLGSLQLICIGVNREVREGNEVVASWLHELFPKRVSRYRNERLVTLHEFASGNLPRYLGQVRVEYRNRTVHIKALDTGFTARDYRTFCDITYATQDLKQWLDLGVNPRHYQPKHFGWLSFLVTAAARKQRMSKA